ncbi:MAG TPA: diguanylate cyclase, partial [Azospirillum sp.]|nr:diguanylate cyclase [Azospirillum sp.]
MTGDAPGRRLARRLIFAIVLASSLITVVITSLQLYQEYRRDIDDIDRRFVQVEESYLDSIRQNVWLADRARLQTLLDGIRRLPDFEYAAVTADGAPFAASGAVPTMGERTRHYTLTQTHRGREVEMGTLTVSASLEGVVRRTLERIWFILAANAVKTSLIALFIYLLVDRLITRRLRAIAAFTRGIGRGDLETALPHVPPARGDEVNALAHSIDEMRQGLRRLNAEAALAASVFANTQEGILVTDADGVIVSVNKAFTAITGYTAAEVVGQRPDLLRSGYQDEAFYAAVREALHSAGFWQGELWNRRKSGEAYLQWESVTAIVGPDGRARHHVAIFSDITEMRRKDETLRYQAYHDALTGLANRALLLDRLEQALSFARRAGSPVAVLFLDLDRFKLVNDSLGHEIGDELLKTAAMRMTACVGTDDTLARTGGDEFAVVRPDAGSTSEVAHLAERLIAALAEPFVLRGHTVHLGASIGIGLFPQDGGDAAALLRNVDAAMFTAKAAGRNTFRFCDSGMNRRALERLDLEASLRRAVPNGELELHYQPQIALGPGRALRGVEALMRWRHPQRGLVPPADFIPLAEETGLIGALGDWALQEACRQARTWLDAGVPLGQMAVNVSARQFEDRHFVRRVADILAATGLPPGALELEVTESMVMAQPEQTARILGELREAGMTVSVDDFGTGYSSLAY